MRLSLVAVSVLITASHAKPEVAVSHSVEQLKVQTAAFQDFATSFQKHYSTDEAVHRFDVFKANHAFIRGVNGLKLSYRLAINEFADLTLKEFAKSHMGTLPVPQGFFGSQLPMHNYSGAALSDSVDWVSAGAVTAVKNQGSCGSCWAFSAIGALESAWKIHGNSLVPLSEQRIVDCVVDYENCCSGCEGGLPLYAMDWAKTNNVCTEDGYAAYSESQGTCTSCSSVGIGAGFVTGWKQVQDEQSLMDALQSQPVSIGVDAAGAFMFYDSGVLTELCGGNDDHAVLLVGYGTDSASGKDYWKVKNSWGPQWGESGYIRLVRNHDGEGTLDYVALGNFLTDSTGQLVHGFLGITYTDSGKTANGEKIYVAYWYSNVGYALYKCIPTSENDWYWIVTDLDTLDTSKCQGYAHAPADVQLSDKPTEWSEVDPSTEEWVTVSGSGVTATGTVNSECGLIEEAIYPTLAASSQAVVV